jgi:hypothetical protein
MFSNKIENVIQMKITKIKLFGLIIFILAISALVAIFLLNSNKVPSENEVKLVRTEFNPDNFVDPIKYSNKNKFHPLTPGMQWIRAGTTEFGSRKIPYQVISTMTDVVRIIDGVPAVAMLDQSTDSGEINEIGFDYMAIDKEGNVWILGGYTEKYEGGEYTNTDSVFLGESNGGEVGILMPAKVSMKTPRWFIGTSGPDEDPSVAEPYAVNLDINVTFGEFNGVLAVKEGEIDAIDNEIKYYAPGVGVILNIPISQSIHQDDFQLVNMVQLTPEGLAEVSQVVLDLEEHAKEVVPEVYGNVEKARRQK